MRMRATVGSRPLTDSYCAGRNLAEVGGRTITTYGRVGTINHCCHVSMPCCRSRVKRRIEGAKSYEMMMNCLSCSPGGEFRETCIEHQPQTT